LWQVGQDNLGVGLYTLWVDHTACEPTTGEKPSIDYLALGGNHQRKTLSATPQVIHFSGSPQGRSPREPGPHGCTLVYIDGAGQARTTSLTTDAVRFQDERLVIDEATSRDHLAAQIRLRARALAAEAEVPLLVTWRIDGRGPLVRQIRRETFSSAIVQSLRAEFGHGERVVWTLSLEPDHVPTLPAGLEEEDSILGDYLRLIRDYQVSPATPLDVQRYVHPRHVASAIGAAARLTEPRARQAALQAAAELGVDLLAAQ
jgi:DNA repair exonuclease SbcCD nuclease subunit